jgi:hypothetical protein
MHGTHGREKKHTQGFGGKNPTERDHTESLGTYCRKTLNLILTLWYTQLPVRRSEPPMSSF